MTGQRHIPHPWEGSARCAGAGRSGLPCGNREIAGLEYCLHHVPDELLDEAEQATGTRRCRQRYGEQDACRYYAVAGTDPPRCKVHGANAGMPAAKAAARNVLERRILDTAAGLVSASLADLDHPDPEGDPLGRMLEMAGLAREWEKIARGVLRHLQTSNWRYQTGRAGEQVRAELLVWERAVERCFGMNERVARLKIDDRLAGVKQQTADMLERALEAALARTGAGPDGQQAGREEFRRRLRVVA